MYGAIYTKQDYNELMNMISDLTLGNDDLNLNKDERLNSFLNIMSYLIFDEDKNEFFISLSKDVLEKLIISYPDCDIIDIRIEVIDSFYKSME